MARKAPPAKAPAAPLRKSGAARKAAPASRSGAKSGASGGASKASKTPKLRPLKDLKPEYAARLRREAKKLGVTVQKLRRTPTLTQRARGHRPDEHKTRRSALLRDVRKVVEDQAYRGEEKDSRSADELEELFLERIASPDYGVAWFRQLERAIKTLNGRYMENGQEPIGIDMETMERVFELPRQELFYH
jgi:hypothetical protein